MNLSVTKQKQWDALVAEARQYFKEYNKIGLKIAELALKACDIVHGGGQHWDQHAGMTTLTRFAVEIGMPYKTLHYWICLKRNVIDKLPNARIEGDRGALRRTQKQVKKNTPASEVAAIYQRELQRPSGEVALMRYELTLRRLKGLAENKKYEFRADELAILRNLAQGVVDALDGRLKLKQRKRA